ncbi:MAG: hypothetical protein ACI4DP_04405 [Candidatus Ornithomonoglobus sp.]
MKKITAAIAASALICAAMTGCGCSKTEPETTETQQQTADASGRGESRVRLGWEDTQDEFIYVYDIAENVFIGTPVSHEYYVENGLPYTAVTVKIEKSIKGELENGEAVISYSGGEMDGEMYTSTSVAVPVEGESYMFLLEAERDGAEYYYPCGGYQGTYKVSGTDDDSVIEEFNTNNLPESDIMGMTVSSLTGKE